MTSAMSLEKAYAYCMKLAHSHYENFPVASVLLPKHLRQPISAIYAFARTADDFADEGNEPENVRLSFLNQYSLQLRQIQQNDYDGNDPIFIALSDVIHNYHLPIDLFEDLLSAFRQDVVKNRYNTFDEVVDYCQRSANPVGRLLLHLMGQPTTEQIEQSDAICTALQLINFYQDIRQDISEQNRVYIPLDKLHEKQLTIDDITCENSIALAPILRSLYAQTSAIMCMGLELGNSLPGRLGWEIRAMTLGGIETLRQLQRQSDRDVLNRPRLSRWKKLKVLTLSLSKNTLNKSLLMNTGITDSDSD
ncbi:MAG TPA: squalene synthase HpnC [Methylophaga aminisulfidivorans]|uniref:Squalene synthase HpnC n=2 Tax=root TaxID=1 RepID=A0A7C1VTP5_9GAMM|nr:squalene synthase HpnC [Methylophaga aminisulfidivorans]